jgi:hypothetical protein
MKARYIVLAVMADGVVLSDTEIEPEAEIRLKLSFR